MGVLETIQTGVDFLWDWPLLIILPGIGLYFTYVLRGIQFRRLCSALRSAFCSRDAGAELQGDMSNFQALMTALAACVGAGNVVGVASAIAAGGPGAVFWMWVTGLIGMATKYAEAVLGVKYRATDEKGGVNGGPVLYLQQAFPGAAGVRLSVVFAMFTIGASMDMVQPNGVADAMQSTLSVPPWVTACALTLAVGIVVVGGVKSISRVAEYMVPFMIAAYVGSGLLVVLLNAPRIPQMFWFIVKDAFTPQAARGFFQGASVQQAIRLGLARGVFSNEAGLGLGAVAAAAARTSHPVQQALVSMTQVFADTIVVCSISAFTILASDSWTKQDPATKEAFTGAKLTIEAFNTGMPGHWLGGFIVTISLLLFVFTSVIAWHYFGERATVFVFGMKGVKYYRVVHLSVVFIGALLASIPQIDGFKLAWAVVDSMNAGLAFANVLGMAFLAKVVVAETRDYFAHGADGSKILAEAVYDHGGDGSGDAPYQTLGDAELAPIRK